MPSSLTIYDFEQVDELLRGWQVHAARQRLIHEDSARRLQARHYWLGVPAAALSAVAGSVAVAAWQTETASDALAVTGAAVGVVATILVSVVTFLDLGARAERHRQASASYKRMIRRLERLPPMAKRIEELAEGDPMYEAVQRLEVELGETDAAAPVPPRRIAYRVEDRLRPELLKGVAFVHGSSSPKGQAATNATSS
jgi:hypothetical protein